MIDVVAATDAVRNLVLWVAELAGFLVLIGFFAFKKFGKDRKSAVGMINGVLDARAARIEAQLQAAEVSREQARQAHEAAQAEIAEARQEAVRIVERAENMSVSLREEALVTAEADKERIIAQAKDEIEAERNQAVLELRSRASDVAVEAAREVLSRTMNDQIDRRMIEEAMVRETEDGRRENV
ncbi:MAG TPA: F0F1 ATP synthase subunit B [Chloroflexota bacterium]|nr:F0F1 ATP synthase subunit B [Chloroflexota bacterium]